MCFNWGGFFKILIGSHTWSRLRGLHLCRPTSLLYYHQMSRSKVKCTLTRTAFCGKFFFEKLGTNKYRQCSGLPKTKKIWAVCWNSEQSHPICAGDSPNHKGHPTASRSAGGPQEARPSPAPSGSAAAAWGRRAPQTATGGGRVARQPVRRTSSRRSARGAGAARV